MTALLLWCSPAWAVDFVIELPDAGEVAVELDDLGGPAPETNYKLRSSEGAKPRDEPIAGYPLNEIFAHYGVENYEEISINEPRGAIKLSEARVNEVPPPAVYVDGAGVLRFIRTSRGPNDANDTEYMRNLVLSRVVQSSDSSLRLRVTASRKRKVGEAVQFQARTQGGSTGEQYDFEWDFGDGSTGEGKDLEHTYDEKDTYVVTVDAVTREGEGRRKVVASREVEVAIGSPKKEPEPEDPAPTTTPPSSTVPPTTYGGDSSATTPYTPSSPTTDPFENVPTDRNPPPSTFGDTVEGALLANVSSSAPLGDAAASAREAARASNPDFDVPESGGAVPPAAWAGVGALFLMGAGAGIESGRRPRLRRPRLRLPIPRR